MGGAADDGWLRSENKTYRAGESCDEGGARVESSRAADELGFLSNQAGNASSNECGIPGFEKNAVYLEGKKRMFLDVGFPIIYSVKFFMMDCLTSYNKIVQASPSCLELICTGAPVHRRLLLKHSKASPLWPHRVWWNSVTLTSRGDHRPLPRSAGLPLLSISSAQKKAKQCGSARFDLIWCGIAICHSGHLDTYKWQKKE